MISVQLCKGVLQVRFYYSFTSRDNLYIVMEYINGGDCFSLLRVLGALDEESARLYIAETVLALEYCHTQVGLTQHCFLHFHCFAWLCNREQEVAASNAVGTYMAASS